MAEEAQGPGEGEPARPPRLPQGRQVPDHVLGDHRARLPEHLRARHGALPPAGVAGRLPGVHQPLLRRALHLRDVPQDVQLRLSSKNDVHAEGEVKWKSEGRNGTGSLSP